MDQIEVQNKKNLSQFIKSAKFLKRVTKLLVSVSVFSLLFSHPTWATFLHSFNFYFSTLPIRLFSHSLDKNCIFLLCNGLLVFLAKYSGLFSSSSSSKYNLTNEYFKNYEDHVSRPQMIVVQREVPSTEKEETQLESTQQTAEVVKRETEQVEQEKQEEQEAESKFLVTWEGEKQTEPAAEEQEEIEESESSFVMKEVLEDKEEEEEEEEEANDMLSNEELNKKFDDFIRKMKEELRIEARQQVVVV